MPHPHYRFQRENQTFWIEKSVWDTLAAIGLCTQWGLAHMRRLAGEHAPEVDALRDLGPGDRVPAWAARAFQGFIEQDGPECDHLAPIEAFHERRRPELVAASYLPMEPLYELAEFLAGGGFILHRA